MSDRSTPFAASPIESTRGLWSRWVLANALGETLGLGLVVGVAVTLAAIFGDPTEGGTRFAFAGAIIVAGALEGFISGAMQWRALRHALPSMPAGAWIGATTLGALVAWTLGMVPSTLLTGSTTTVAEPAQGVVYLLAIAMGAVLGAILGVLQWRALRRRVDNSGWWIPANAVAWALAMPVIFVAIDIVTTVGLPVAAVVPIMVLACGVAGTIVGALHGVTLVWLLQSPRMPAIRFIASEKIVIRRFDTAGVR